MGAPGFVLFFLFGLIKLHFCNYGGRRRLKPTSNPLSFLPNSLNQVNFLQFNFPLLKVWKPPQGPSGELGEAGERRFERPRRSGEAGFCPFLPRREQRPGRPASCVPARQRSEELRPGRPQTARGDGCQGPGPPGVPAPSLPGRNAQAPAAAGGSARARRQREAPPRQLSLRARGARRAAARTCPGPRRPPCAAPGARPAGGESGGDARRSVEAGQPRSPDALPSPRPARPLGPRVVLGPRMGIASPGRARASAPGWLASPRPRPAV